MVIWKFPLEVRDRQVIRMPEGARILSIQKQGAIPTMWALVSPDAELVDRVLLTFGTGHYIPDLTIGPLEYVDTYQDPPYVWHVFEDHGSNNG